MPLDDPEPIIHELPMAPPQLVRPIDERLADSLSDLMRRRLGKAVREMAQSAHKRWPNRSLGWNVEWVYREDSCSYAVRMQVFPIGEVSELLGIHKPSVGTV